MHEVIASIPDDELFPVMKCIKEDPDPHIFDFSHANSELNAMDLNDEPAFSHYIFDTIKKNNSLYGIGRYNEDRIIYKRSDVFGSERSIHLGIDIWAPAGQEIFVPMKGTVHSFHNNNNHGDYGPTIILQHQWSGIVFYTLYGHLSRQSLIELQAGASVEGGTGIATLGNYEENVHWPPHLHFQVILDLEGKSGDYPGVCAPNERDKYLRNCPNPNLLLRISQLEKQDVGPV